MLGSNRIAARLGAIVAIVGAAGCASAPSSDRTSVESSSACSTIKVVAAGRYGEDTYALGAGDRLGEAIYASWLAAQDLPDMPDGLVIASTVLNDPSVAPM